VTHSEAVAAAAGAFTLGAMRVAQERPGNPRRVHMQRFGSATAICAAARPEHDFMNSLIGLRAPDAGRIEEVTGFYRGHGVRGWTEVAPGADAEAVMDALTAAGWRQIGFHASFAGEPARVPSASEVAVREIDASRASLFGRVLAAGHEVPEGERDQAAADMGGWATVPGWRLYLAELDGRPAAAGVLTMDAGIAYLANVSCLPEARGRGCQTALVARRMADAVDAGADLVCALAAFGSVSHRNLIRAGLSLTHTQAVWRMSG
jgi:Acetyltransferase (GNAT) domain